MSTTAVRANPPTSGEQYRRRFQRNVYDSAFPKVPVPIYRHAAPSAPWPWMDFDVDSGEDHPIPPGLPNDCEWNQYPQCLFRNWTRDQIGLFDDGVFDKQVEARKVDDAADLRAYWKYLGVPSPSNVRVQTLFVEDMSLPVLQMLGTRYNVEPFFFASSVNWIPSRYQEDARALEDHITVVLPFIRTFKNQNQPPIARTRPLTIQTLTSAESQSQRPAEEPLPYTEGKQVIDTQAPLPLPENKTLAQDLLSLHMVRHATTSTIISYHPDLQVQGNSARHLQRLVQRTGDSVYWSNIYKRSKDPTFLFIAILWYALYAWDEAFEVLFRYINALEHEVLKFNDIKLTRELHKLQAHLMHYQQLLRDFLRSVEFVRETPNPAMNAPSISKAEYEDSAKLLRTEADNLISEIERLTWQREMLSDRLENAIHLAFATVNIGESKGMQQLAELEMKDAAAMKQIGYLTMVFLPATYLANVFSMNVGEINHQARGSLAHYIVAAVTFTLSASWLVIAIQKESFFYPKDSGVLHRALWPLFYAYGVISTKIQRRTKLSNRRPPPDIRPSQTSNEKVA